MSNSQALCKVNPARDCYEEYTSSVLDPRIIHSSLPTIFGISGQLACKIITTKIGICEASGSGLVKPKAATAKARPAADIDPMVPAVVFAVVWGCLIVIAHQQS